VNNGTQPKLAFTRQSNYSYSIRKKKQQKIVCAVLPFDANRTAHTYTGPSLCMSSPPDSKLAETWIRSLASLVTEIGTV